MENLENIQNFDELLTEITNFLNENFPVLVIVGLIVVGILFYILKSGYNRRNSLKRDQMQQWKKLKAKNPRLTNKLSLKLYPFGENNFEIKGDIHVIDSSISTKKYNIESIINEDLEEIDRNIDVLRAEKKGGKGRKTTPIINQIEKLEKERTKILEETRDLDKEKVLTIRDKMETYVSYDSKNSELVGFRMTGLKPAQNVLSETGFLELSRIDPRRSNWIIYIMLVFSFAFEFILIWSIANETEPDFLFGSDMWGWYFSLAIFTLCVFYIIKVMMGFYAICYSYQTTREDVKLVQQNGEEFTINVNVYWIKVYFYPNIQISEVLHINTDSLAKKINTENLRLVSELSSTIANLKSDNQFLNTMLNKKHAVIDTMGEKLEIERALGYKEGRQDNQATPTIAEFRQEGNFDWNSIITKAIPFIFGLIALIVVIVVLKSVADSIELDSTQTTILMLGGIGLILFLLFVGIRGVFESTARKAI